MNSMLINKMEEKRMEYLDKWEKYPDIVFINQHDYLVLEFDEPKTGNLNRILSSPNIDRSLRFYGCIVLPISEGGEDGGIFMETQDLEKLLDRQDSGSTISFEKSSKDRKLEIIKLPAVGLESYKYFKKIDF